MQTCCSSHLAEWSAGNLNYDRLEGSRRLEHRLDDGDKGNAGNARWYLDNEVCSASATCKHEELQ